MRRRDVKELLELISSNDPSIKVLRMKNYLLADTNQEVIEAVLDALYDNVSVEALYIQNLEKGMLDPQLRKLAGVLRRGRIWVLNVGENFGITTPAWRSFAEELAHTNVTHMYAGSEHSLPISIKKRMMDIIRENRKTDRRHRMLSHFDVIRQIGQMWWNPRLPICRTLYRNAKAGCWACHSNVAEDSFLFCSGRGCHAKYHVQCLDDVDVANGGKSKDQLIQAAQAAYNGGKGRSPTKSTSTWLCASCMERGAEGRRGGGWVTNNIHARDRARAAASADKALAVLVSRCSTVGRRIMVCLGDAGNTHHVMSEAEAAQVGLVPVGKKGARCSSARGSGAVRGGRVSSSAYSPTQGKCGSAGEGKGKGKGKSKGLFRAAGGYRSCTLPVTIITSAGGGSEKGGKKSASSTAPASSASGTSISTSTVTKSEGTWRIGHILRQRGRRGPVLVRFTSGGSTTGSDSASSSSSFSSTAAAAAAAVQFDMWISLDGPKAPRYCLGTELVLARRDGKRGWWPAEVFSFSENCPEEVAREGIGQRFVCFFTGAPGESTPEGSCNSTGKVEDEVKGQIKGQGQGKEKPRRGTPRRAKMAAAAAMASSPLRINTKKKKKNGAAAEKYEYSWIPNLSASLVPLRSTALSGAAASGLHLDSVEAWPGMGAMGSAENNTEAYARAIAHAKMELALQKRLQAEEANAERVRSAEAAANSSTPHKASLDMLSASAAAPSSPGRAKKRRAKSDEALARALERADRTLQERQIGECGRARETPKRHTVTMTNGGPRSPSPCSLSGGGRSRKSPRRVTKRQRRL